MGGLGRLRRWAAYAAASAFALTLVAGAAAAAKNVVPNPSFERSLKGWGHYQARLARVTGGKVGRHAAKVIYKSGSGTYSIYTTPAPVRAVVAGRRLPKGSTTAREGDTFRASAWVKPSVAGKSICLQIREWDGKTPLNTPANCVTTQRRWQKLTSVPYSVRNTGDAVDVIIYQSAPVRGESFLVDGVTLVKQPATPLPPPSPNDPAIVAAGDIASCASTGDEATAALVRGFPDLPVLTLGDNVYESGTPAEFANCFEPTWGQFKDRIHPTPGEHEYETPGAAGYFSYFGPVAGDPGKGYYSFDVGRWHIIALNTLCRPIGGCGAGSPQGVWLRQDLASHSNRCTLAYGAFPRFSSGTTHGSDVTMQPLWQTLYDYNADVILNGHEHNYERFAPQTPSGAADSARGIREFVVGTGGRSHYALGAPKPNSEVRDGSTFGVLKLTLHPSGYDWQFIPEAGHAFTDSGSGSCH